MESKPTSAADVPLTRRATLQWATAAAGAWMAEQAAGQTRKPAVPKSSAVAWDSLQGKLQGRVVLRQDTDYEKDRESLLRNALKPRRFPEAIVHVASEKDVQEAVRFARRNRLKVAIRGGGHSFCDSPVRQGGLLLDLARLNALQLDPARKSAVAQPTIKARDAIPILTAQGLAFPFGHCAPVPLSGYLLNGGDGWNSGAWGPACLSVQALDLVNAEGESIRADPQQNADYYWAARGAGPGFFGVVTRYYLQVYALPKVIRTSTLTYRLEDAERVADWLPGMIRSLPPQVETVCFIVSAPPQAQGAAAAATHKLLIVGAVAYADTEEDATRWLEPVADAPQAPERKQELNQPATFLSLYDLTTPLFPEKRRYVVDMFSSSASPRELLMRLHEQILALPSPESWVLLALPSPRPASAPPLPDMAFSMGGSAIVGLHSIWQDPTQDGRNEQWVSETSRMLDPFKVNYYIGETDLTMGADRAPRSFAPAHWQRLQQLRQKYDPEGLFFSYLGPT
ncbi:MAG: FAD-binding oxidoreductase [Planctomycetes bacterium]|nr:FAD-binding oxidoreductase [Planctomycetota bacterium]